MPSEPSIVSASRRYWFLILLGAVLGVGAIFVFDAAQPTRHRADTALVLSQPAKIGSEMGRTERFALEQTQIIESPSVAARAAEKLNIDQRSVLEAVSVWAETDESSLVIVQYTVDETNHSAAQARELALAGTEAVVDSYLEVSGQIAAEELRITEAVVGVQLDYVVEAIGEMYKLDLNETGERMAERLTLQRSRIVSLLSLRQTDALRRANPLLQRVAPTGSYEVRASESAMNLVLAFSIGTGLGALAAYAVAMRRYFAAGGAMATTETSTDPTAAYA